MRGASRDTGHQEGAWGSIKPAQATNGYERSLHHPSAKLILTRFGFTDSAATGSPASVHQAPRYQCLSPGCKNTRGFERFRDLERHRDTVHKKSRSTVCEACGKQLSRGDKLAEHRRKFHDHAPVEYTFVEQAPSA